MFQKTNIQRAAIELFKTKAKEFLLVGGSRCFAKGTLVQTLSGYKPIETITTSDYVLSFNTSTQKQSFQKVLKTYHNSAVHSKQMIIFEMRNGSQIECTEHHELYFEGIWQPARRLAERAMEKDNWLRRPVLDQRLWKVENVRMERFERYQDNETGFGCEWLFENYDLERWKSKDTKNSSVSCRSVYIKSIKQAPGQSYRSRSAKQLCSESRVVYASRKYRPLRKSRSSIIKPRYSKWLRQSQRETSIGNSSQIQTSHLYAENVSCGIRGRSHNNKGYREQSKLEASFINLDDIIAVSYYSANIETFDLCVENNHNYTVTKDNIVVHNSGKSFIIIFTQILIALKYPGSRHLVARFRFNSVKNSIWSDTLLKVLKLCFPGVSPKWNNQDYFITFANGSQIWIAGLDDKERAEKILGMEFLTIFLNEASQISFDAYSIIKTRLAQLVDGARNMLFIDENPPSRKHWTHKVFIEKVDAEQNTPLEADRYGWIRMNPIDNLNNISKEYMEILNSMPERKKQRFLRGEFSDDTEGALWTDDLINFTRVTNAPAFSRVIVSIDPAVTSKDTSDETGLMVCGLGFDGHFYLLEDLSDIYPVNEWAKQAVAAYHRHQADRIIGEVNNGGDLIESVIRQVDRNVSYKSVHATRDKLTRAEPVAALYEQGKAHHVGQFLEAELEMTSWSAKAGEKSPNRIDALVWGATELVLANVQQWADLFAD